MQRDHEILSNSPPMILQPTRVLKNKLRFVRNLFRPHELKYGVLLLTHSCNISCPYCWVPYNVTSELDVEEWKNIVNRLSQWGVTHFNILGGEPLLRPELTLELVDHIGRLGCGPTVTTNGVLLNEILVRKLAAAGLFCLIVSNDRIAGGGKRKGDLPKVKELLLLARSLGVVPVVHCVITAININEVCRIADDVTRSGLFFSCSIYQAVGGSQSTMNNLLLPDPQDVEDVFAELIRIKKRTNLVRTTYDYLANYSKLGGQNGKIWHCNPEKTKYVAVKSDGKLMICAEWATSKSVMEIERIPGNEWDTIKKALALSCEGCYYECYYSEEQVFTFRGLLRELPIRSSFWLSVVKLISAHWSMAIGRKG